MFGLTQLGLGAFASALIFASGAVSAGINDWTSIGPFGGSASALAIDPQNPDTVYVWTSGGVFKTTNGGASWTGTSSGLPPGYNAHSLVIDPQNPNTIYVGGACGVYGFCGVFKSTDGGISWTPINLGLDGSVQVIYSLAIDPQNPTTLYAGTSACFQTSGSPGYIEGAENLCYRPGVFKTTNGGASWTGASSGLPLASVQFGSVSALAIDPQTPTTAYAGTFGGVFKTIDGGMTWSAAKSGLPCCYAATALIVDPRTPSTIYGTALSGAVITSTDGGASWSTATHPVTSAVCCGSFAIDLQNPNVVYLGGAYGVFKSTDGGKTWADTDLPSWRALGGTPSVGIAVDPRNPGTVYAATDGLGVFKSTDRATSWSAVNFGLSATIVQSSALDPQIPGTIYAATNAGLVKTTNRGASWGPADSGLPTGFAPSSLVVDPKNPGTIYAGSLPTSYPSGIPSGGGIFKSVDGGANWSEASPAPAVGNFSGTLALDPQSPSTVYAGSTSWRLLKSTDGGTSWSETASFANPLTALAIDPQTPSTLYVAAEWQAFKSTDSGASWSDLRVPIDSIGDCDICRPIGILAVDPQNSSTLYAAGSVGVMKSTDGGASWNAMNSGLTPWSPGSDIISALVIDPQSSNTVYLAIAGRVFKSTDGAANWIEVNSWLKTLTSVTTLALDPKNPSTLYAGTSGGGIFAITFMPAPIGVALQQAVAAMKTAATTDSLNFWQWAYYWQYLPAFSGAPAGFGVVGSISPELMEKIVMAGGGDPMRNISAEQWASCFRQVVPQ